MICSKLKLSSLIILTIALSACSPESKKDGKGVNLGNERNFEREDRTNFWVDSVSVTSSSIAAFNSFGMPKSKLFNFRACVKDANNAAVLERTKFRLTDNAGGSMLITVPIDGCLYWTETHEYQVLADETFYRLRRTVVAEPPYRGSVKIDVAFNPWADGGSSIKDLRFTQLGPNEPLVDLGPISVRGGRIAAQQVRPTLNLNVDSLNFEFQGLDYDNYSINNLLGLTVAHRYLIRIRPVALRKTMNRVVVPEAFVGGRMKAYFALFKENKDPAVQYSMSNLISVTEMELADDLRVGTFFSDNMVIKFDRIADMTSRTAALLTLVPQDGAEGLGELSFSGVMRPGRLASLSLVPSTVSARDFADAYRIEREKPITAIEAYAQVRGAKVLETTPVKISGFFSSRTYDPTKDLTTVLNAREPNKVATRDLMQALCARLYANDAVWLRACQNSPQYHMKLEARDFVEKVMGPPRLAGLTTTQRLSMSVSYSLSESETNSSGSSVRMGGGLGVGLTEILMGLGGLVAGPGGVAGGKLIGDALSSAGLKFSIGSDYYTSAEARSSTSRSSSATVSSGMDVTAEGNTFQFDALTRRCLVVSSQNHEVPSVSKTPKTPRAAYLCARDSRQVKATETYYLLGQNLGNSGSPFSDSDAANSTNWRMMVRGRQNALLLFDFLSKADLDLVINKIPDAATMGPLSKEFNTIQDFPGVLSQQ